MQLEYDKEQEKQLRITEIEAFLNNGLYKNDVERHCLNIELQFLQGSTNSYEEPYACIEINDMIVDVIHENDNNFSATIYTKDGCPQLPYLNSENLEELVKQLLAIQEC